jgi:hypothetical protein
VLLLVLLELVSGQYEQLLENSGLYLEYGVMV